ncbi:MAG: hypothetical protein ABIX01_22980 [Chitinophagaceae bacterium]
MKTLSETWFAEGFIDFELKKYTLLAYLQQVDGFFNENKLYPQLADVIFHHNNLLHFRDNKQYLQQQFPKRLTQPDMQRLQVLYQAMIEDDEMMKELEDIMHYALKKMKSTIEGGTEIYEFVEEKMNITPVGLIPLDCQEGYFFLADGCFSDTRVYQYRLSIFEKHDERYRSIKTEFIADWQRSISNTYESIKSELIRHRQQLRNPAVYSIETELKFPVEETLLPIAKRRLVRYLCEG